MTNHMKESPAQNEAESNEKIRKAVKVLQAPGGTVQQKQTFLIEVKGLTDNEFLSALNIASNGAVLDTVFA